MDRNHEHEGLYGRFEAHAGLAVFLLILFQVIAWTLVPAAVFRNLPLDVIESLAWGHEWQLGYFKHPPLPAWILESLAVVSGRAEWALYLASQLSIAVTYWAIWSLGKALVGRTAAALAVFLTALIYYFNFPTVEFNHNILQIPFWALICLVAWNIIDKARSRDWLLLGLLVGASVYVKYSMAIVVVLLAAFFIVEPTARSRLWSRGLLIAVAAALLVALPHLVWLVQSDFQPLAYASERTRELPGVLSAVVASLKFLAAQIADHGGPIAVLLLGGAIWPLRATQKTEPVSFAARSRLARRYLLWIAFAPVLFTAALSLALATEFRTMWGTPMVSFTALAVLALMKPAFYRRRFAAMSLGWAALYLGVLIAIAATGLAGQYVRDKPSRTDWPGRQIGAYFQTLWHENTGTRLAYVGGNPWLAGNIAFYANERPSLVHLGDTTKSPWANPQALACKGVLIVWEEKKADVAPTPEAYGLSSNRVTAQGTADFPWKTAAPPIAVGWIIAAPEAGCSTD